MALPFGKKTMDEVVKREAEIMKKNIEGMMDEAVGLEVKIKVNDKTSPIFGNGYSQVLSSSGQFGFASEEERQEWKRRFELSKKIVEETEGEKKKKEKVKAIQEKEKFKRSIEI